MTKEEAVNKAIEIEFGLGNTRSIREHNSSLVKIAEHVYDLLQPSLPSNLEEAAGEYLERPENNSSNQWEDLMIYNAFIDGAEWMAGQGETQEHFVIGTIADSPCGPAIVCYTNEFEIGDEVIVQIRKKY